MGDNKKFWNRFAGMYTSIQQKSNAQMYQQAAEDFSEYFTAEKRVLELAMGTGQFTFSLCDRVSYYEATDFSENMLSEAKKIRSEGIVYACQDATDLTYADGSFDIVLAANMLHIMPNPQAALSEIHRVLADGGIAVLPTFIYEGKVNRFRLFIMKLGGFKVYHRWNLKQYIDAVQESGFVVKKHTLYPSKIGPECVLIAEKIAKK